MKKLMMIAVAGLSLTAVAKERVVYGIDNRMEIFESPVKIQKVAKATAAMVKNTKLVKAGHGYMMKPTTLKKSYNMCAGSRFNDQPTSASCSSFLIGPDLLVTAGHCVTNKYDCQDVSFVFDFKVSQNTGRADVLVKKENVYKCKEVIDAKLEKVSSSMHYDYSLIRLDRKVKNVTPLKYRKNGKIKQNQKIFVIGHPTGLPSKYAPGATVQENSATSHFVANLDTFGGNSGSGVFNQDNLMIEGILVRGAKDYDSDGPCTMVQEYDDQLNLAENGESVSRIGSIPTLGKRDKIVKAIEEREIDLATNLIAQADEKVLNLADHLGNTIAHYAIESDVNEINQALMSSKANLDLENLKGITAKEIALRKITNKLTLKK
jgi:V8-like Glu-specific endopeptidase